MAAIRSATPRRARWCGTSRTRCRCTASRCTAPRPDLIDKYPTHDDQKNRWRVPVLFKTVQQANKDAVKSYPLIMTSGRLTEYEGGGDETRSNPWLAELQQEMFVEINPKDANDRGVRNNEYVWVESPTKARLKVKTLVTERVASGTVFLPFHFAGWSRARTCSTSIPRARPPWCAARRSIPRRLMVTTS